MDKLVSMYLAVEFWAKEKMDNLFKKEDGAVDIIAIVVLIAIAVALAIVFRKQIGDLMTKLWSTINGSVGDATAKY